MPRKNPGRATGSAAVLLVLVLIALIGLIFLANDQGGTPTPATSAPGAGLTVVMLDVGQGDSILVRGPTGKTMLVDAGGSEKVAEESILPRLRALGVSRLDYLLLTHPHQDHVGGMATVLAALPTDATVLSGEISTNDDYREFLMTVQRRKVQAVQARRGVNLDLGEDVAAEVLNPPGVLFEESNDNSVVVRVTYGRVSVLLMGDAEERAIESMLEARLPLESAVLKVGHHGSANATSKALLQAVRPDYALISVGVNNPFKHPHRETLSLLNEAGAEVYRTDQHGTVIVTTDGQTIQVSTAKD